MSAPDLFGILDVVKRLTPPAGLEAAHVDGFSWARNGLSYGDSTKLTADDWNRIVANLRMMLIGSGVDLDTLDPASPSLLTAVLQAYLGAAVIAILSGEDVGGYGMMPKTTYDPNDDGVIGLEQGGTGTSAATVEELREALGLGEGIFASKTAPTGDVVGTTDVQTLTNKTLNLLKVGTSATITYADNGAGAGPAVYLQRHSDSPVANDWIGLVSLDGRDGAGNWNTYASIVGYIINPADGAEAGGILFGTQLGGVWSIRAHLAQGLIMVGASGGDQGDGSVNSTGFFVNGVRLGGSASDAVLEDRKSSGTSGGTTVASTWTAHVLNTEVSDARGIVSLSSNQFTVTVAGSARWWVTCFRTKMITRLYDVTAGAEVGRGSVARGDTGPDTGGQSSGSAPLAAGHTYELQYFDLNGPTSSGLGAAASQGTEVYACVEIGRAEQ